MLRKAAFGISCRTRREPRSLPTKSPPGPSYGLISHNSIAKTGGEDH